MLEVVTGSGDGGVTTIGGVGCSGVLEAVVVSVGGVVVESGVVVPTVSGVVVLVS